MSYSAYLFDLDGTLYSRDELVRRLVVEQQREFQQELGHVEASDYINRVIELDAHGYFPKEQLYIQIGKELGLDQGVQTRLLSHFWDRYDAHCELPEDTLTTLRALRKQGVQLGIVTNGRVDRQEGKIAALGIRDYFDTVLISEAEGLKKPHPEIFHRAVKRCRTSVDEAVFIGDHPIADIDGARNVGLAAIWKKVPYWDMARADVVVVDRLAELLG